MTIQQIAMQLWPYWMMGIMMIYLTWSSEYRNVLRIEPRAILKFCRILAIVALGRFLVYKYLASPEIIEQTAGVAKMIPWQALLGVFWEDAVHSMPLVLAGLMFAKNKWYEWLSKPTIVLVMASFASGHVYQGVGPALAISLYILISMNLGKKYGFGTVMICHILYDMSTLLLFRWMLG